MNLIALVGYSQCGKDRLAAALRDNYGYCVTGVADAMRATLSDALDAKVDNDTLIDVRNSGGNVRITTTNISARNVMMRLGSLSPQLWLDKMWSAVRDESAVVVKDVRRMCEAEYLRDRGAIVAYVCRNGIGPRDSYEEELMQWTMVYNFDAHLFLSDGADTAPPATFLVALGARRR